MNRTRKFDVTFAGIDDKKKTRAANFEMTTAAMTTGSFTTTIEATI